jgi:hypothetical protein
MNCRKAPRSDTELARSLPKKVVSLEVYFSKPVVARVRKCRLVVVKNKRSQENGETEEILKT